METNPPLYKINMNTIKNNQYYKKYQTQLEECDLQSIDVFKKGMEIFKESNMGPSLIVLLCVGKQVKHMTQPLVNI